MTIPQMESNRVTSFVAPSVPVPVAGEETEPNDTDVLFGRCKVCFNHIGNIKFRLVIQARVKEYERAVSRREKSRIVYSVVQHVSNYGGRFLKKTASRENSSWRTVSITEAIQKVGHALRDKKHHDTRTKSKSATSTTAATSRPKHPAKNNRIERHCNLLLQLGEVCAKEVQLHRTQKQTTAATAVVSPDPKKRPGDRTIPVRHERHREMSSEEQSCAQAILEIRKTLIRSDTADAGLRRAPVVAPPTATPPSGRCGIQNGKENRTANRGAPSEKRREGAVSSSSSSSAAQERLFRVYSKRRPIIPATLLRAQDHLACG